MSDTENQQNEALENEEVQDELNNQDKSLNEQNEDDDDLGEEIRKIYLEKKSNEESLLNYIEGLLKKKRKGYGEAKKSRMEKEELLEKYEALKKQFDTAESERVKQLQDELNALKQEKEEFARLANERAAEKAKLAFNFAAEKHKVKDTEYMDFLLKKHISEVNEDQLKDFKVDEWMSELKKNKPDLFGDGGKERSYATSGLNTTTAATQNSTSTVKSVSRSAKEKAEANNEWLQWKKANGYK